MDSHHFNFWKLVIEFEESMAASINTGNALGLRNRALFCASLIETAKFSMNIGRTNRAIAYLLLAKKYWISSHL